MLQPATLEVHMIPKLISVLRGWSLYLQAEAGNILNEPTEIINGFQVRLLLVGDRAYPSTILLVKSSPYHLNLTEEEKKLIKNFLHTKLQLREHLNY